MVTVEGDVDAASKITDAPELDRPMHLVGMPAALRGMSRGAAIGSISIGALVLFGYVVRWRTAVQLHSSLPPMYPNAAVGFVLGGASAMFAISNRRERQRVGLVGFSLLLALFVTSFVLHVIDAGPTIVEILWPDDPFVAATTPVGGRPVVEMCVAFIGVGSAGVLLARRKSARWSQGLALGGVSVGSAAVLGFLIGVDRVDLYYTYINRRNGI